MKLKCLVFGICGMLCCSLFGVTAFVLGILAEAKRGRNPDAATKLSRMGLFAGAIGPYMIENSFLPRAFLN